MLIGKISTHGMVVDDIFITFIIIVMISTSSLSSKAFSINIWWF